MIASGGAGTFEHFVDVFTAGRADAALAASIFHYSEHAVRDLKQFLRDARRADAPAGSQPMLIPSIDLRAAVSCSSCRASGSRSRPATSTAGSSASRASRKVQLIDLDAAMGAGDNERSCATSARGCPAGSAAASAPSTRARVARARRAAVIVGSSLFRTATVNVAVRVERLSRGGRRRTVHRRGRQPRRPRSSIARLADDARRSRPTEAVRVLEPFVGEFLYTHVDREGLMQGTDMAGHRRRARRDVATPHGRRRHHDQDEVMALDRIGVDAVVGMAIYTGRMSLPGANAGEIEVPSPLCDDAATLPLLLSSLSPGLLQTGGPFLRTERARARRHAGRHDRQPPDRHATRTRAPGRTSSISCACSASRSACRKPTPPRLDRPIGTRVEHHRRSQGSRSEAVGHRLRTTTRSPRDPAPPTMRSASAVALEAARVLAARAESQLDADGPRHRRRGMAD